MNATMRFVAAATMSFLSLWVSHAASVAEEQVVLAKMGIESLSEGQVAELWKMVKEYATVEAYLNACGQPAHIERRMRAAAGSCVSNEALKLVSERFRSQAAHWQKYVTPDMCSSVEGKKRIEVFRNMIERQVSEAATMCRMCLTC